MKRPLRQLLVAMLCLMSFTAIGQRTLSGTVTAASSGETLIGVNILIKGTTTGTVTDFDGNYSLEIPSDDAILILSYTGFATKEVLVGAASQLDISLEEGSEVLDEVLVIGYGSQKRGDVTTAISSINGEDIGQLPVASVELAMQGRAAGVNISSSSGQPGAALKVQIRGATSITASSEPLYVVDGIPMTSDNNSSLFTGGYNFNSMADINPDDIESIDILKDASAAAIYGSRGANGVVLITTKRGKSGKGKIEFDTYFGTQAPAKVIEMMNSAEFINMMNEASANDGYIDNWFSDPNSFNFIGDPNDPDLINTDWYGEILRDDAPISNYSLSASGGSDKFSYYVNGSYFDQDGFQKGTSFNRMSARTNLDAQVNDILKIGTNVMISRSDSKSTVGDNSLYGVMINALAADPTMPVQEEDGTYADPFSYFSWWAFENPRAATDIYERNTFTNRFLGSVFAELSLASGLKFRTSWSADYQNLEDQLYYPSTTLQAIRGGITGLGQYASAETITWLNENTLNYNFSLGAQHNLSVLAGFTMQETDQDFVDITGENFANDNLGAIALAADITNGSTQGTSWGLISYLARANYNFDNKYYLTASIRTDGSSRFGEESRYGVFPSFSASWRVSSEPFLANSDWLYDLKLRASWGLTGNQDGINNFASRSLWTSAVNYNGAAGTSPSRMGNADLGWESTSQYDIGFDLSLFDGRVNLTVDYFDKRTTDLLLNSNVPGFSGFTTVTRNIGEVKNVGWEFALNTVNFQTSGGFRWSTNFNISTIENEITRLEQDGELQGTTHILKQGYPLGTFNLIRWEGIDPETGNSIFTDTNGDGAINSGDATIVEENGKALTVWPDFFGGITNTFSYKGFDLSVFFQYSSGNYLWNHSRYAQEQVGWSFNFGGFFLPYGNNTKRVEEERWRQAGDITDIPRAGLGYVFDDDGNVIGEYQNWQEDSDQWLEDASFIRLKTLEFGYNLPKNLMTQIGLSSSKIYFRGQNLWTSTKYLGVDPEVSSNGESVTRPGEDYGGLGQPRTLIFGIKIGI